MDKAKIKTVKELNEALEVGESYIVEGTAHCEEYPNIPKEVWHVKRKKISRDKFSIIQLD